MHGILVGHSFVRRIRNHCAVYRDIDFQRGRNSRDARELASSLGWYNCINYAYTLSDSCNIYQDLPQNFTTQCDILVLNMGSNDLACLSRIDRNAVHRLVHKYFEWALRTGARSVVIIGVLRRTGRLRCTSDVFNANRQTFNRKMKSLCARVDKTHFQKLRGFESTSGQHSLSVARWSQDGIHPSSMTHYIRRLAFAVMDHFMNF